MIAYHLTVPVERTVRYFIFHFIKGSVNTVKNKKIKKIKIKIKIKWYDDYPVIPVKRRRRNTSKKTFHWKGKLQRISHQKNCFFKTKGKRA